MVNSDMTKEAHLTVNDFYSIATFLRKRSYLVVNGEFPGPQVKSNQKAQMYYKKCVDLLPSRSAPKEEYTMDVTLLSSFYYVGSLLQNSWNPDNKEINMWDRSVMIREAIRWYIDFLWILINTGIVAMQGCVFLISAVLPDGIEGEYDLSRLEDSQYADKMKELDRALQDEEARANNSESSSKAPPSSSTLVSPLEKLETQKREKLQSQALKAVKGILECRDELAMYESSAREFADEAGCEVTVGEEFVEF